jgi:hypothetical protein
MRAELHVVRGCLSCRRHDRRAAALRAARSRLRGDLFDDRDGRFAQHRTVRASARPAARGLRGHLPSVRGGMRASRSPSRALQDLRSRVSALRGIVPARDAGYRRCERARSDELTRCPPAGRSARDRTERGAIADGMQMPLRSAVNARCALVGATANPGGKIAALTAGARDSIAQCRTPLLTGRRIQKIDGRCGDCCSCGGQANGCRDVGTLATTTQEEHASTRCKHLVLLERGKTGEAGCIESRHERRSCSAVSEQARGACRELLRTKQLGDRDAAQSALAQAL